MSRERYPSTGTSEDLLAVLARGEARLHVNAGPRAGPASAVARHFAEPLFNLAGLAVRCLVELAPSRAVLWGQDRLFQFLSGSAHFPLDSRADGLREARLLAEGLERMSGKRPAAVCVMSHPPVTQESLDLNVEMSRQALYALATLRGDTAATRPRIVVAVDAYALDMLGAVQAGTYAGFMGAYHLGFDRLIHSRGAWSRRVIAVSAWPRITWRLCRLLASGGEVGIVLAGGIPFTSRVLYSTRELLGRLRSARRRDLAPREVLDRLLGESADFADFFRRGPAQGAVRRSVWRLMELWAVSLLVGEWGGDAPAGPSDADSGRVSARVREAMAQCSRALGCPEKTFVAEWALFEEEFSRETPYRARFFSMLAKRVVRRGRAVLLMPFTHELDPSPRAGKPGIRLTWGRPVALTAAEGDKFYFLRAGRNARESAIVGDFARTFVRSNFM